MFSERTAGVLGLHHTADCLIPVRGPVPYPNIIIIIIIIYSLRIGAGQQGRISGTYSCPTHTHPFNGPFSGTTQVNRYQKGETNLDFTEARDSEW